MTGFAKLSDNFWRNPKIRSTNVRGSFLYVLAISYSSDHDTDGRIDRFALQAIGGTKAIAAYLVERNLWEEDGDGWRIHDWADHNLTSAERAERGKKGADARWKKGQQPAVPDAVSNAIALQGALRIDAPSINSHMRFDAYTDADADTDADTRDLTNVSSLRGAAPQEDDPLANEPPAVRDIFGQVFMLLPSRQQRDGGKTFNETLAFARQFAGRASDVARAIDACQRANKIPWPAQLRPHMPGWNADDGTPRDIRGKQLTPEAQQLTAELAERERRRAAAGNAS